MRADLPMQRGHKRIYEQVNSQGVGRASNHCMSAASAASRRNKPMRAGRELSYTIGSVLCFTMT